MSFGRKGIGGDAVMAERRAAFLAEERARKSQEQGRRPAASSAPVFVREKSLVLWFFCGGIAAHRFYLGFPVSGAIQAALLPLTWALIVSGSLGAFLTMAGSGLWLLADAFMLPGLQREANARARSNAAANAFA
jgi:TM2 domain-containing membrane protein YozV